MAESVTGRAMRSEYIDENRVGDHICYYSDLQRIKQDFPAWEITVPLPKIFEEIASNWANRV